MKNTPCAIEHATLSPTEDLVPLEEPDYAIVECHEDHLIGWFLEHPFFLPDALQLQEQWLEEVATPRDLLGALSDIGGSVCIVPQHSNNVWRPVKKNN